MTPESPVKKRGQGLPLCRISRVCKYFFYKFIGIYAFGQLRHSHMPIWFEITLGFGFGGPVLVSYDNCIARHAMNAPAAPDIFFGTLPRMSPVILGSAAAPYLFSPLNYQCSRSPNSCRKVHPPPRYSPSQMASFHHDLAMSGRHARKSWGVLDLIKLGFRHSFEQMMI